MKKATKKLPRKTSAVKKQSTTATPRSAKAIKPFDLSAQQQYIELLLRGASPAAAASQISVPLMTIVETLAEDEPFRIKVDAANDALSQNVAARLYQEAMKGSVTAMTFWLKHRPPPEWPDTCGSSSQLEELDQLSEAELIRLARLENIEVPSELETGAILPGGPEEPPPLS